VADPKNLFFRHRVVDDLLAEHGAGGGRAAVQRVGPVLDPDAPLVMIFLLAQQEEVMGAH
jgi:hypothetical protein